MTIVVTFVVIDVEVVGRREHCDDSREARHFVLTVHSVSVQITSIIP